VSGRIEGGKLENTPIHDGNGELFTILTLLWAKTARQEKMVRV
jgi:hypothetical protein